MKTFCFLNNKGGVGKTATVTTVGHMMAALHKKRVLLVDMDPQHNSSARFSDREWTEIFLAIYNRQDVHYEEKSVEDILLDRDFDPHEAIRHTEFEGLDIMPSYLTLATCEEKIKADVANIQQFRLKNQLEKLKDEYDFCLIDCSPSISILNINALAASDEVFLPIRTDGDSCIGMAISFNLIKDVQVYNPSLSVGGVILTQCNWQEGVAKTTYELLTMCLPKDKIVPIQIGNTKYLKEYSFEQKPLLLLDRGKKKTRVTQAYMLLTEYLISPNRVSFVRKNADRIAELKHFEIEEE